MTTPLFIPFASSISSIKLPERFTFPFYYEPHALCRLAAKELQDYLSTQKDWQHNFGLDPQKEGMIIGKMFGVLVVQDQNGIFGYLAAFSGKLANANHLPNFVPPVFDMLTKDGFYKIEEEQISALNDEIEQLEQAHEFLEAQTHFESEQQLRTERLARSKTALKTAKNIRKVRREEAQDFLSKEEYADFLEALKKESLNQQYYHKRLTKYWDQRLEKSQTAYQKLVDQIRQLKTERKTRSAALQERLFKEYSFLNQAGEMKSLYDIFLPTAYKIPPAGAGECAAPKLLHYAFQHQLKPIAMAEFWWGQSPRSEIRQHQQFYPACRGKCEPILKHMLQGIDLDENPMLTNPAIGKKLTILFEDEHLAVIEKPHEFLSVPGRTIQDAVATRMKQRYPTATGPLVVHRLDMSTSGIMLIAKNNEIYKHLQAQFIQRSVQKRYVALLGGLLLQKEGLIDLPLRLDYDDRPRQCVCYEHGKAAQTKWEVIAQENGKTRIYFYPVTGRTHQLRVHAAHQLGLNLPIVGDDLYGKKADRLYLHANWIAFEHPISKKSIEFESSAPF